MRPLSVLWLLPLVAVMLSGCAAITRGLGPASPPGEAPPLYTMEREFRDGVVHVAPGRPAVTVKPRVAIVIGNSDYRSVQPLTNPRRDAEAMARMLQRQGFHVIQGYDLSKKAFQKLLRGAVVAGGPNAEIVAFYAGHGFQVGSRNYLVPVDARLSGANDLPLQTVRLQTLHRILNYRPTRHVLLLDSCRDNPFPGQSGKPGISALASPIEVGFSEPAVPIGGLVAYATQPGGVAFEGEGSPNSPYTAALLRRAGARPGAPITSTLEQVRSDVQSATRGRQTPTWTSRLTGSFAFQPAETTLAQVSRATAAGSTGALMPVSTAAAGSVPRPAPAQASSVTVTAPMEQVVAIGGRIADALGLPPTASISISKAASGGQVATVTTDGGLTVAEPQWVSGDRIGALVYTLPPDERPAPGRIDDATITERLTAKFSTPGAPAQTVSIDLQLTPHPCDFAAGDRLDLQGVGLYRAGGIRSSSYAVAACSAAIGQEPGSGRFHYLLGKAYEADGDRAAALESYATAAALGHVRAWHALGERALDVHGPGPVATDYFQRGADAGDPLAVESLGILKLRSASSLAEREEAYDMIGFAMDLGLADGMRALADHFGDPRSPDYDPGRSAVLTRELETQFPRRQAPDSGRNRIEPRDRSVGGDGSDGGGGGEGGGGY